RGARQIEKAVSLYRQRRYTEAGLQLERALQSDPESHEVHRELARVLWASGSRERCRTHLQKAVQLQPDDLVLQYLLGVAAAEDGDRPQGILHLRTALKCSDAGSVADFRALALFRLAELLQEEGYLTASLEAYRLYGDATKALEEDAEVDPELATLLQVNRGHPGRRMSMVYEQLGDFDRAAEVLDGALQGGVPEMADRERLVRLWSKAGRHEQALAQARAIVAQDSSAIDLLLEAHRLAGHADQAAEDLAELAASQPDEPRLLFAYVDLLHKLDRTAEAESRLRQFADAHPQQLEVRWRLLELYADRQAWGEALAVAADVARTDVTGAVTARWKVVALPPEAAGQLLEQGEIGGGEADYAVWYLLGCLALESGRLDQAETLLGRALGQSAEFVPAKIELAALHNRRYRWEDCLNLLTGLGEEPGDARVEWLRGEASAGLDRNDQAVAHFSAAVRLNPNDTRSMKALAELYERTDKPLQALRQYRAALAVNPLDEESREALTTLYISTNDREEAVSHLEELQKQAASPNRVARCLARLQLDPRSADFDQFRKTLTEAMATGGRDAQSLRYVAMSYFTEGRFDEALVAINEAAELAPEDPAVLLALEYACRMTLQFERGAEVLRGLLRRYPHRTDWVRLLADLLITLQDYDGGLAVLGEQLDRPDLEEADRRQYRLDLIEALTAARRFDEQIEVLLGWHGESPADTSIRERLVDAHLAADRAADALPLVEKWYAAEPTSAELLGTLAGLLVQTGQAPRAFQLVLDWMENDPDNEELQLLLAMLLRDAERYDDAVELITNCVTGTSDALRFQHQMFLVYAAAGRHEKAIELLNDLIYQQADDLRFDSDFYRRLMSERLILADRGDEAIKRLKRWIEQSGDPQTRLLFMRQLGAAQQQSGLLRQAMETLEQAYALDPRDAGTNNDLAYNWADAGMRLEEAEKCLRYAVSQDPRNSAFLDSLGWVLYKKGDSAGAIEWLTRAAGAGPEDDAVILDHLGDALWRSGRAQEAVERWRRALSRAQEAVADDGDLVRPEDRRVLDSAAEKIARVGSGEEPPVAPLGESVESPGDDRERACAEPVAGSLLRL
ncbi:MAG TPA: tetratricopeptide repeat protein, partial [Phycisphaerae bacterium]|nr:tetratricopeptide repeat protein [Phycisphaerae bacterium]